MLDKMREGSKGVTSKIILGVIILSFALAGVGGYLGGSNVAVAVKVNDVEISQSAVDQAYKKERSRLQEQYGEQFELLSSSPNFAQQVRMQAMQTLISESLLRQAISEMGLRASDEQIKNEIRSMKEFQVDGKFNNEQYLALLRRANFTPTQFSASLKEDLVRRQLLQVLVGSEFVTEVEVETANRLQSQTRVASILTINPSNFKAEVISKNEIQSYYDANGSQFQSPEQVNLDYVLLDGAELKNNIVVTDADVDTYYDHNQADYKRPERRKVAHILIQGDTEEAKQQAEAILSQLNKGGNFAKLAKEKSQDTFSAKNDGELDWFEKGVMDPAFDDAAFSLTKKSPLSKLVKSKFGYHIIKLVDIQESETLPLSAVKTQVLASIKKEKMGEAYFELQQQLSEVAFESPDSLDESAGAINAQVKNSGYITAQSASGVLANKAVLKIAFDADFRDQGMNSELIELGDNKAIVVRVNSYKEAATKALTDVSTLIENQLKKQKQQDNAKAYVKLIMQKLNSNEDITAELASKNITFSDKLTLMRYAQEQDQQVVQKAFQLAKPSSDMPAYGWTRASTGTFAIIKLFKVIKAEGDVALKPQIENVLSRSSSEATYQALLALLRDNAEITYPAN